MIDLLSSLKNISRPKGNEPSDWLSGAESAVEFLKQNATSDTLVLYASTDCVLIHGVLALLKKLDPPDQEDLSHDFVRSSSAWTIEFATGGGEPDRVSLIPGIQNLGKTFVGGEQLVFRRSFEGRDIRSLEISQKLIHALNLHFVTERSAFCRLNSDGDIEDVIKITEQRSKDWRENVTVVTILTKDFAEYMSLAGLGMVVFFDFTRTRRGSFSGWSGTKPIDYRARDLFYHGGVMGGEASYVNGRMIVRSSVSYDDIVRAHRQKIFPERTDFAVFKAISLKTGERIEASCDPKKLSNYFQPESELPLEMSPAFFRAEVLHKYKADPEKYDLQDRSVECRGTWSLETFDVNDAGQVHTYLRYLNRLPYNEQLYWQSFSEWPKGPISKRALTTDFKGEFFHGRDPVNTLKHRTMDLDELEPPWWQPRGDELRKVVHNPATTSPAEWAEAVLALDHLVNEGFSFKPLRGMLQALGLKPEADWKTFKTLEELLKANGLDEDDARGAIAALRALRDLRNLLKGHAVLEKRRKLEQEARTKFGSFRAHFENLAESTDNALALIARTLLPRVQNSATPDSSRSSP